MIDEFSEAGEKLELQGIQDPLFNADEGLRSDVAFPSQVPVRKPAGEMYWA